MERERTFKQLGAHIIFKKKEEVKSVCSVLQEYQKRKNVWN